MHYRLQSTPKLNYLCNCNIEFFISAAFRVSPCCEEQMAYFEVAVMCAEGWTDEWDRLSLCYFFFFPLPLNLAPPCIHHATAMCVCICLHSCEDLRGHTSFFVFMYICANAFLCFCVCVLVYPSPHKGPTRVHWLGRSACSVAMRASLVWLGGSSTIS